MSTLNFLEIERHARELQSAAVREAFTRLFEAVAHALHLPHRESHGGGFGHAH